MRSVTQHDECAMCIETISLAVAYMNMTGLDYAIASGGDSHRAAVAR